MRLACRIASVRNGNDDCALALWREYVIPGLVSSDVQLAEHMWECVLNGTEQVMSGLTEYWESLEQTDMAWSIDEVLERANEARGKDAVGQEPPRNFIGSGPAVDSSTLRSMEWKSIPPS